MKLLRYFILMSLLFSLSLCKQNTSNKTAKQSNDTLFAGILMNADTIKPPIVKQAGAPTTIAVPTKGGSFYTIKKKDGTEVKVNLLPPQKNLLDTLLAQGNSNFATYTTDNGLALDAISSACIDKTGNLWFGTGGGGVSRYDGKSFTNFTTQQGLANNNVLSITEDKTGNLWFGTQGGGVSRLTVEQLQKKNDKVKFITYTTADGLPDDVVTQVVEGDDGKLYIGTNLGICELIKQPNEENYKVGLIYNSATGYPVKDVNAGQNGMYKDSKGIIWIATGADKTALVRFDERAVNKNPDAPTVVLQSIKINEENICWYNLNASENDSTTKSQQEVMTYGKSLSGQERDTLQKKFAEIKFDGITKFYPMPENLVLPYNHNSVTFNFVEVEPSKNYLCRYQYILEGYDKDWSPVTEKTEATFGVWSESITYTFKVLPPWQRTWWMYTIYVLFFVIVIGGFIKWRERSLRREKEVLEEKVELRTVQLAEKTKLAEEQKTIAEEQKKHIEEKQKEILDSINYAKRIQVALMPTEKYIERILNKWNKDNKN